MNVFRSKILEYYSDLIDNIDKECEICISKNRKIYRYSFDQEREKVISKIKQVEKAKMIDLKQSETLYDKIFCFLIPPNNDFDSDDDDDDNRKYYRRHYYRSRSIFHKKDIKPCFSTVIGKLVVVDIPLNNDFVEYLKRKWGTSKQFFPRFKENDLTDFENKIKNQILCARIKDKQHLSLIDLTQLEINSLEKVSIESKRQLSFFESGFIKSNRGVEERDILKAREIRRIMANPQDVSKNPEQFKYLEKIGFLKIVGETFWQNQKNFFYSLKNLNDLDISECIFDLSLLNGLDMLKRMKLNKNFLINFPLDCFKSLKNLESLEIFENEFDGFTRKSFRFENLKVLESDIEANAIEAGRLFEILNHQHKIFKAQPWFKNLKFLNIGEQCQIVDVDFLNELTQLEFLDFKLPYSLLRDFERVMLPSLRHLITRGKYVPNFNKSFKSLKGLELIKPKYFPSLNFGNLTSLDCFVIKDPGEWLLKNLDQNILFEGMRNLKYIRIESSLIEMYDKRKMDSVINSLSTLFKSVKDLVRLSEVDKRLKIEISVSYENEKLKENIYLERYSQLSECIQHFVLDNQFKYSQTRSKDI